MAATRGLNFNVLLRIAQVQYRSKTKTETKKCSPKCAKYTCVRLSPFLHPIMNCAEGLPQQRLVVAGRDTPRPALGFKGAHMLKAPVGAVPGSVSAIHFKAHVSEADACEARRGEIGASPVLVHFPRTPVRLAVEARFASGVKASVASWESES